MNPTIKSEFFKQAFLTLIPVVTQAYARKYNLPFAGSGKDARERLEERSDEVEAIADVTRLIAGKMTAHWEDGDTYYREEAVSEE